MVLEKKNKHHYLRKRKSESTKQIPLEKIIAIGDERPPLKSSLENHWVLLAGKVPDVPENSGKEKKDS